MRKIVGISQRTKRAWLDALLDKIVQTTDEAELRGYLDTQLKSDLPGKESRAKSAGILLRIWGTSPPERASLRSRAVAMLPEITGDERIWLHWGMTAMAYPFFRDTAEVVGRLLALQDDFTTAQVQARMLTTWGDRATTKEAVQKLLNSLADWEVLRSAKVKGHFLPAKQVTATNPKMQLWLLEALLAASAADEIEAQQLLRLPESFPFMFNVSVADLRKHEGFNIHRQGLDMDIVSLRRSKLDAPPKRINKKSGPKKTSGPHEPTLFDAALARVASSTCSAEPESATAETVRHCQDGEERHAIEESIRRELLQTLTGRVDRVLEMRGTNIVPNGPFADASVECVKLYRDGHYLGCIALTQAVLEAVIRHVWQVACKRKPTQDGRFDTNLEALHRMRLIDDEWRIKLDRMWADRHVFHHLCCSVERDRQKLERMARDTLRLLNDLVQQFFGFAVHEGAIVPDHPEYWSITDGSALVFVRGHG